MTEQTESGLLHSGELAEQSGGSVSAGGAAQQDDIESTQRLGPSRGLVLGVILGLAFWAIIALMIWL